MGHGLSPVSGILSHTEVSFVTGVGIKQGLGDLCESYWTSIRSTKRDQSANSELVGSEEFYRNAPLKRSNLVAANPIVVTWCYL